MSAQFNLPKPFDGSGNYISIVPCVRFTREAASRSRKSLVIASSYRILLNHCVESPLLEFRREF
jgi:hypothetical protein